MNTKEKKEKDIDKYWRLVSNYNHMRIHLYRMTVRLGWRYWGWWRIQVWSILAEEFSLCKHDLMKGISCHLIFNMNNFIRRKKEHSMIIIELKVVKFPDFRRWFL